MEYGMYCLVNCINIISQFKFDSHRAPISELHLFFSFPLILDQYCESYIDLTVVLVSTLSNLFEHRKYQGMFSFDFIQT